MARRNKNKRRFEIPTWVMVSLAIGAAWFGLYQLQHTLGMPLPFQVPGFAEIKTAFADLYGYQNGTARSPKPLLPSEADNEALEVAAPPVSEGTTTGAGTFTVDMIDVGQGLSVLLTAPGGERALIDAGPPEAKEALVAHLESAGVTALSYLIVTHPHMDHIGGMTTILEKYPVENIVMGPVPKEIAPTTDGYIKFLETVKAKGKRISQPKPGETLALGAVTLKVLGPVKTYDNLNDSSLILEADYLKSRCLITGDASSASERDTLEQGTLSPCALLIAGHHGSRTATSKELLEALQPALIGVSCAEGNEYGHPHQDFIKRTEKTAATLLRTDIRGTVRFASDGTGAFAVAA